MKVSILEYILLAFKIATQLLFYFATAESMIKDQIITTLSNKTWQLGELQNSDGVNNLKLQWLSVRFIAYSLPWN